MTPQNGLAFSGNSDAVLYIVAPLLGFTIMLLFIAEPLRNLGRYTVPEVVALRFAGRRVCGFTAAAALVVTIFYLIAQMVGAGALIEILLGVPYSLAVVVVATLMMLSLYWRGLTRRGALAGGAVGLISSTGMLIAGPAIWVDVLGYARPLFGSNYPTLIALPLALLTAWAVSMLDA